MDILGRETLSLKTDEEKPYSYNKESLQKLKDEIETFLENKGKYLNDRSLAQKFLGCQEIQANSSIEGYNYDAGTIEKVITDDYHDRKPSERERIITNLYDGYQEIQKGCPINKNNLRKLYGILSNGLLSSEDQSNMGKYYREGPVEIHYSRNVETMPDEGLDESLIEEYMDSLFEFLNDPKDINSPSDYYIKSQIAHFYFVYIHPYFDVNGRTARTLAIWYLLNNETYPYIIFARAIPLAKRTYNRSILIAKRTYNLTQFLKLMLENVKVELEKEYIISQINDSVSGSLTEEDYQNIRYILSMNGDITAKDFTAFYSKINGKTKYKQVRDNMLNPLLEKKIIKKIRETQGGNNFLFEINTENLKDTSPKVLQKHH